MVQKSVVTIYFILECYHTFQEPFNEEKIWNALTAILKNSTYQATVHVNVPDSHCLQLTQVKSTKMLESLPEAAKELLSGRWQRLHNLLEEVKTLHDGEYLLVENENEMLEIWTESIGCGYALLILIFFRVIFSFSVTRNGLELRLKKRVSSPTMIGSIMKKFNFQVVLMAFQFTLRWFGTLLKAVFQHHFCHQIQIISILKNVEVDFVEAFAEGVAVVEEVEEEAVIVDVAAATVEEVVAAIQIVANQFSIMI